ncbi:MAG: hypothetical protein V1690_02165 [Candidatus Moraniibacteriota bacterium]
MVDDPLREKFAVYAVEPKDGNGLRAICLVIGFSEDEDPKHTEHTAMDFLECDHYSRLFGRADGPDKVTEDIAEIESFVLDLAMKSNKVKGDCKLSIDRTSLIFEGRTVSYVKVKASIVS